VECITLAALAPLQAPRSRATLLCVRILENTFKTAVEVAMELARHAQATTPLGSTLHRAAREPGTEWQSPARHARVVSTTRLAATSLLEQVPARHARPMGQESIMPTAPAPILELPCLARLALLGTTWQAAEALQLGIASNAMATARVTQRDSTVPVAPRVAMVSRLPALPVPLEASIKTAAERVMAHAPHVKDGV